MKMFRCITAGAIAALALCMNFAFADMRLPAVQVGYTIAHSADYLADHAVITSQAETRTAAVEAQTGTLAYLGLNAGYLSISHGYAAISSIAGQGVWLTCRTVS